MRRGDRRSTGRRVVGVVTDGGTIGCDILVNCAGLWAKRVGEHGGRARSPPASSSTSISSPRRSSTFDAGLTTLRDPDNNFYLKPDTGAFAIGGWEDGTKGCMARHAAASISAASCSPPNMDRLELFALPAAERLPVLNEIGIQTVINGPIPVSADGEPIMGLAPELDNFYVACGFTAGIAASGGAGQAMANWIVDGDAGHGPVAVRRAPLRRAAGAGALSRGARHRGLWRLLQDPLAGRGDACGARPAALAAA